MVGRELIFLPYICHKGTTKVAVVLYISKPVGGMIVLV